MRKGKSLKSYILLPSWKMFSTLEWKWKHCKTCEHYDPNWIFDSYILIL